MLPLATATATLLYWPTAYYCYYCYYYDFFSCSEPATVQAFNNSMRAPVSRYNNNYYYYYFCFYFYIYFYCYCYCYYYYYSNSTAQEFIGLRS